MVDYLLDLFLVELEYLLGWSKATAADWADRGKQMKEKMERVMAKLRYKLGMRFSMEESRR